MARRRSQRLDRPRRLVCNQTPATLARQLAQTWARLATVRQVRNAIHKSVDIERFADHGLNQAGGLKRPRGVGAC